MKGENDIREFLKYMEKKSENISLPKIEEYFLKLSKTTLNQTEATLLAEVILKYIDVVINISSDKEYRQQIKFCRQWLNIIPQVVTENFQTVFVNTVTKGIFDILIEEDISGWCVKKEILKTFIVCIQKVKKEIRYGATKTLSDIYLLKIIDSISTYGDFDFQVILIELVFRMYGKNAIVPKLTDLLPESEELSQSFAKINGDTFDEDVRHFLNTLNKSTGKVFSIICKDVFVGLTKCGEPMENVDGLWVDFNLSEDAVSFYRIEEPPTDASSQENDPVWKMEMFFVTDVDLVRVYRLPLNNEAIVFVKLKVPCIDSHSQVLDNVSQATDIKFVVSFNCKDTKTLINRILPNMFRHKFHHDVPKVSIAKKSVYKPLKVSVMRRARSDSAKTKLDTSFSRGVDPLTSNSDVSSLGKGSRRRSTSSASTRHEVISISDSDSCSTKSNVEAGKTVMRAEEKRYDAAPGHGKVLEDPAQRQEGKVSTSKPFGRKENMVKVSVSVPRKVRAKETLEEKKEEQEKEFRSAEQGHKKHYSDSDCLEMAREYVDASDLDLGLSSRNEPKGVLETSFNRENRGNKVSASLSKKFGSKETQKAEKKLQKKDHRSVERDDKSQNYDSDCFEVPLNEGDDENQRLKKLSTGLRKGERKEQEDGHQSLEGVKEIPETPNFDSENFETARELPEASEPKNKTKIFEVPLDRAEDKAKMSASLSERFESGQARKQTSKEQNQNQNSDSDCFEVPLSRDDKRKVSAPLSQKFQVKTARKGKDKEREIEHERVEDVRDVLESPNLDSNNFEAEFAETSELDLVLAAHNQPKKLLEIPRKREESKDKESASVSKEVQTKGLQKGQEREGKDKENQNSESDYFETARECAEVLDSDDNMDKVSASLTKKTQPCELQKGKSKEQQKLRETVEGNKETPENQGSDSDIFETAPEFVESSELDLGLDAHKQDGKLQKTHLKTDKESTSVSEKAQTKELQKRKNERQEKEAESVERVKENQNSESEYFETAREYAEADSDLGTFSINEQITVLEVSLNKEDNAKKVSEWLSKKTRNEQNKEQESVPQSVEGDKETPDNLKSDSDTFKTAQTFSQASDLDLVLVVPKKPKKIPKIRLKRENNKDKKSALVSKKIQTKELRKRKNKQLEKEEESAEKDKENRNTESEYFETARECTEASDSDLGLSPSKKQRKVLEPPFNGEDNRDKASVSLSKKLQVKEPRKRTTREQEKSHQSMEHDKQVRQTREVECLSSASLQSTTLSKKHETVESLEEKSEGQQKKHENMERHKLEADGTSQSSKNAFANDSDDVVTVIDTGNLASSEDEHKSTSASRNVIRRRKNRDDSQETEDPFITDGGYDLLEGLSQRATAGVEESESAEVVQIVLSSSEEDRQKAVRESRGGSEEIFEKGEEDVLKKSNRKDLSEEDGTQDVSGKSRNDEGVEKMEDVFNMEDLLEKHSRKVEDQCETEKAKEKINISRKLPDSVEEIEEIGKARSDSLEEPNQEDVPDSSGGIEKASTEEDKSSQKDVPRKNGRGSVSKKIHGVKKVKVGAKKTKKQALASKVEVGVSDQDIKKLRKDSFEEIEEVIGQDGTDSIEGPNQEDVPDSSERIEKASTEEEKLGQKDVPPRNGTGKVSQKIRAVRKCKGGAKKMKKQALDSNVEVEVSGGRIKKPRKWQDSTEEIEVTGGDGGDSLEEPNLEDVPDCFEKIEVAPTEEELASQNNVPLKNKTGKVPDKIHGAKKAAKKPKKRVLDSEVEDEVSNMKDTSKFEEVDRMPECVVWITRLFVSSDLPRSAPKETESLRDATSWSDDSSPTMKSDTHAVRAGELTDLRQECEILFDIMKKEDLEKSKNKPTNNVEVIILNSQDSNREEQFAGYSQETQIHECEARRQEDPIEVPENTDEMHKQSDAKEIQKIVETAQPDDVNKTVVDETLATTMRRRKLPKQPDVKEFQEIETPLPDGLDKTVVDETRRKLHKKLDAKEFQEIESPLPDGLDKTVLDEMPLTTMGRRETGTKEVPEIVETPQQDDLNKTVVDEMPATTMGRKKLQKRLDVKEFQEVETPLPDGVNKTVVDEMPATALGRKKLHKKPDVKEFQEIVETPLPDGLNKTVADEMPATTTGRKKHKKLDAKEFQEIETPLSDGVNKTVVDDETLPTTTGRRKLYKKPDKKEFLETVETSLPGGLNKMVVDEMPATRGRKKLHKQLDAKEFLLDGRNKTVLDEMPLRTVGRGKLRKQPDAEEFPEIVETPLPDGLNKTVVNKTPATTMGIRKLYNANEAISRCEMTLDDHKSQDLQEKSKSKLTENVEANFSNRQDSNREERLESTPQKSRTNERDARQANDPIEVHENANEIRKDADPIRFEETAEKRQPNDGNKTVFDQTLSTTLGKRKLYNPNDLTYLESLEKFDEFDSKVEDNAAVSRLKENTLVEKIVVQLDEKSFAKNNRVHRTNHPVYSDRKHKKAKSKLEKYKPRIIPRSDVVLRIDEDPDRLRLKTTFYEVLQSFRKDLKTSLPEIIRANQTKLEKHRKKERKSERHSRRRERRHREEAEVEDRVVREDVDSDELDVSLKLKTDEATPKKKINIISDIQIRPKRSLLEEEPDVRHKKAKTGREDVPVEPGDSHCDETIIKTRTFFEHLCMCPVLENLVRHPNESPEYSDALTLYKICKKYNTH